MFEMIGEGHKIMAEGPKKEIDLDELEKLAAKADPLPWKLKMHLGKVIRVTENGNERYIADCLRTEKRSLRCKANAAYIVAACNHAPDLIAENRELRERVRDLERQRKILAELAIYGNGCFDCPLEEVCSYKEETVRDSKICSQLLIEWAEQASKEAGE